MSMRDCIVATLILATVVLVTVAAAYAGDQLGRALS